MRFVKYVWPILIAAGCDPPPLTPNGVVAVFGKQGIGPGEFGYPRAIASSPNGKIYIVDKTARVQRFDADGNFETLWSMPESQAGKPVGLTVHPDGRVFVADTHYGRIIVFDADGNELSRFGESDTDESRIPLPTDVAIDAAGFIYVSEYHVNDRVTRWRELVVDGQSSFEFDTVLIDGDVAGRPLRRPSALAIDSDQRLWVADSCNHRILQFDLTGRLLTEFGTMGKEPGQLRYPYDIDITPDGDLLVCEYGNCRLQWFDFDGNSLRVWGGPGRELGRLNSPWGAIIGPDGRVFVVDSLNARIQVIRL